MPNCVVCQASDQDTPPQQVPDLLQVGLRQLRRADLRPRCSASKMCSDQFFFGDDDEYGRAACAPSGRGRGACGGRERLRGPGARDARHPRPPDLPALRGPRPTASRREIPSLPGCFHLSADEAAREAREVESLGIAGRHPLRPARGQGPGGQRGLRRGRRRAAGRARHPRGVPRPARDDRRLPVRVHVARPLRRGGRATRSRTTPPWSCWRRMAVVPRPGRARTWWPRPT